VLGLSASRALHALAGSYANRAIMGVRRFRLCASRFHLREGWGGQIGVTSRSYFLSA